LSRLGRAPGLRGRFTTGDLDQCNTFARIGYRMIGQEGLPKRTYRTLVFFPVFGGVCLLTPNPKAVKRLTGSFAVGGPRRIVTASPKRSVPASLFVVM